MLEASVGGWFWEHGHGENRKGYVNTYGEVLIKRKSGRVAIEPLEW